MSSSTEWCRQHPDKKKEMDKRYREKHKDELSAKAKINYREHKEERSLGARQYYLDNRNTIITRVKEYRKNNPEKVRSAWDKWESEHPERMEESKEARDNDPIKRELKKKKAHEYYLANKDKIIKRAWYRWEHCTPEQRKKHNDAIMADYYKDKSKYRLRESIRRQYKRAGGTFTKDEWLEILDKYDYRCAYCGSKEKITIDHAIPLSKNGLNIKENIVPACLSCNSKKKDRTPEEFRKACSKWLANRHYQEVMKLEFN